MSDAPQDQLVETVRNSLALKQLMKALPADCEIHLILDGRDNAYLSYKDHDLHLDQSTGQKPHFTAEVSTEALRRFQLHPPEDLTGLCKLLVYEQLSGGVVWTWNLSLVEMRQKGYLQSLKDLGPALQGEVYQSLFMLLAKAQSHIDPLKSFLKSFLPKP